MTVRPLFVILVAAHVAGAELARPATSAADASSSTLDVLLADYKSYDLPSPSDDAKLVRRKLTCGMVNGVQQYRYELAFVVKSAGQQNYWEGCELQSGRQNSIDEAVAPTPEILATVETAETRDTRNRFPSFPDLALAVQCKARGWNELAAALLERSNRRLPSSVFDRQPPRPADPRKALAVLAWNYWCNVFTTGNRADALNRLKKLSEGPCGLDTKAHRNIVGDMEKTLVHSRAKPGTAEAAVDALTQEMVYGCGPDADDTPWRQATGGGENLRRLRDMGLEAVPILLEHLHDYRLTCSIQTTQGGAYAWHVRIADAVAGLLNGLYGEKEGFAYDFQAAEGRGRSLDERHVLHWWQVLKAFLNDKDKRMLGSGKSSLFEGPCAEFTFERVEVGDFVALQIAHMLDLKVNADASWKRENWAEIRRTVDRALSGETGSGGKE